jgi:hypothetical protein
MTKPNNVKIDRNKHHRSKDLLFNGFRIPLAQAIPRVYQDEFSFIGNDIAEMPTPLLKRSEKSDSELAKNTFIELIELELISAMTVRSLFQALMDPYVTQLFKSNEAIKSLLTEVTFILSDYVRFHQQKLSKLNSQLIKNSNQHTTMEMNAQLDGFYDLEFLAYQRRLALSLPLFMMLDKVLLAPWRGKEITAAIKKASISVYKQREPMTAHVNIFCPKEIVLMGRLAITITQTLVSRANKIALIYAYVSQGALAHSNLQVIAFDVAKISAFVRNITSTSTALDEILPDKHGVRDIFCNKSRFSSLVNKGKKDNKTLKVLYFLKDLSHLIESGAFIQDDFCAKASVLITAKVVEMEMPFLFDKSENVHFEPLRNRSQAARLLFDMAERAFFIAEGPVKKALIDNNDKTNHMVKEVIRDGNEETILYGPHLPPVNEDKESVALNEDKFKDAGRVLLHTAISITPGLIFLAVPFVGPILTLAALGVLSVGSIAGNATAFVLLDKDAANDSKLSHNRYRFSTVSANDCQIHREVDAMLKNDSEVKKTRKEQSAFKTSYESFPREKELFSGMRKRI